jgi:hypothetical protein
MHVVREGERAESDDERSHEPHGWRPFLRESDRGVKSASSNDQATRSTDDERATYGF